MAARQAETPGRRLMGPIQVLLWISLARGFAAMRERGGDGDSDLFERQGSSARWRHGREDGGEDTGEDSGGDSGEDTREEDKEERRRGRSTTTTTGRVDEDARPVGESSRSGVDALAAGAGEPAVERAADAGADDAAGEGARTGGLAP